MPAEELATRLTGGVTLAELPADIVSAVGRTMRPTDFVLRPLPNTLFMRDTSAWIYGGVSINAMFWPARQHETLNLEAVYRFHPRFRDAGFEIWFGGVDHDWGSASLEGGDIMPVGDGVVLVGQGERSQRAGREHPGQEPVRGRCGAAGDRRADAALARGDAPRHGVHVLRPPRRDDVRAGRVARSRRSCTRPTATAACAAKVSERSFIDELKDALGLTDLTAGRDRRRRVRGRAQPVGRRQQRRRALARARSSPTSATRPPTPSWPRPASRCSRSPARSSAAGAAAATA